MIAHLGMPKSIHVDSLNLSNLSYWNWRDVILLARAARSSTYVPDVIFVLEIFKAYPLFPLCTHHRNKTRKIIKRYGLNVLPCIVSLYMGIGCLLPKCSPMNVVVDYE